VDRFLRDSRRGGALALGLGLTGRRREGMSVLVGDLAAVVPLILTLYVLMASLPYS
jgi:hypothetical protein